MPKTVKVGAHVYAILRKPKSQIDGDLGECSFDNVQIIIAKGLRKSVAKVTLVHEILHAATYPSLDGKTMTDEDFVLGVSPVLLQVLQENPLLVEYLTAG